MEIWQRFLRGRKSRYILWPLLLAVTAALCFWALPGQMISGYKPDFAGRPIPESGQNREPLVPAVYLVVVDGLRLDVTQMPDKMPFLASLKQTGAAWGKATVDPPTYSRPGYERLISGAPAELTGVVMNDQAMASPVPTLFSLAAGKGLRTAASAYYWIRELAEGGAEPEFQGGLYSGVNIEHGYFYTGDDEPDTRVFASAKDFIRQYNPNFLLILPMSADTAGHEYGGGSRTYRDNATEIDSVLADFFRSLPDKNYLAIITADHGHRDAGGHGGTENEVTTVPVFFFGQGVSPGELKEPVRQLDIAPTVAAALGLPMPGSMGGRVLSEVFSDSGPWQVRQDDLCDAQDEFLENNRDLLGFEGRASESGFTAIWAAARRAYLKRGLLLRLPLAVLFLAVIACFVIMDIRKRGWRWPMMAGFAYPLYFYALLRLARADYSYSAIASQSEFTVAVLLAALVSLIILCWAGAALRRGREPFFRSVSLGAWAIQAGLTVVSWLMVGGAFHRFLPDLNWQVFLLVQLPVTAVVSMFTLAGWAAARLSPRLHLFRRRREGKTPPSASLS